MREHPHATNETKPGAMSALAWTCLSRYTHGAAARRTISRLRFYLLALALSALFLSPSQPCAGEEEPPRAARSVHLWYPAPQAGLFYNEVTVEQSYPGTYFCVCGFNHGYFGIQELIRPGEKVVIFSVWDPGKQDNPNEVDPDRRVKVLHEGEGVRVSRFGNEGTGGKSMFPYQWKVGERYRFLVKAQVEGNRTSYEAYFYLNESKQWKHLVTFQTITSGDLLNGYYSFVEDFWRNGVSAAQQRRARYGNGWVRTAEGQWIALTDATFTADNTPTLNIDAGVQGDDFFLTTGGDTENHTPLRSKIARPPVGEKPAEPTLKVAVKRKPTDSDWQYRETRTLAALPDFDLTAEKTRLDQYGGRTDDRLEATGFFHARKIADRWWLIDPLGHRFLHIGVCSVSPGKSGMSREAAIERFGTDEQWAKATASLLREHGFNGTGAWSATDVLRASDKPPVYTQTWSFMGAFGRARKLVRQEPGHLGYTGKCIPVFHPEFEAFCDTYARQLIEKRSDPYLLGHFSDNELPLASDILDRSLELDVNNPDLRPGYGAARAWLTERRGESAGPDDITDADRAAFLEHACERYFRITTQAIRRHDPNHLCLGPRLYGSSLRTPEVFRAAGRHLDVVAVNYYGAWTPDRQRMAMWVRESGKPFLITEWYAKGMDSGLPNNTGAGWTVRTQQDRGRFYQNFTLALLESGGCVGWHWFKYRDNNPLDLSTDPSNRDSNKGIINWQFEPYAPLLEAMKEINTNAYRLVEYFDAR